MCLLERRGRNRPIPGTYRRAKEMAHTPQRVPHQLITHRDWHPDGLLEIRYDYPFSEPHALREKVIRISAAEIAPERRADLEHLRSALLRRLEVAPIRVPHEEIRPTVNPGILTVVTR